MNSKSVAPIYYILTGLTGLSVTMVFFGWFRQFGLLFGFQLSSIVVTLVAWFVVMATGFHIIGKLAAKFQKPLKAVSVLLIAAATYILLQSFIFEGIDRIYNRIIAIQNPSTFTAGIVHLLLSFLFFLVPIGLISGFFPLFVTPFIRYLSQSGVFVSITIISISLGIILSLFIIPIIISIAGIGVLYPVAAFILYLICIILIVFTKKISLADISLRTFNVYEKTKTAIRFKKKRAVPDVSTKLTRAMLYGFVFQTFIFAGMVIAGIRIIMNYSVLRPPSFYSFLLAVILAGISIGAFLYNKIADKPGNKYLTLATLQIISGFAALLSYVAISVFAKILFKIVMNTTSRTVILGYELALFSMLFLLPAILYGMSFPLAGKIHPRRIQQMGNTFGQLGKLAFFSITFAVIITPFIIIPILGLHAGFFLLSIMMLFSGIYLVSRDSRLIRLFRLGYASASVILFIITASAFRVFKDSGNQQYVFRKIEGSGATFKAIQETKSITSVYLNGDFITGTGKNSLKEQILSATLPITIRKNIQSALVIGFGTGITSRLLDDYGTKEIHITEIFPEMVKLSSDVFSELNNDVMTSSSVNISIQDARSYMLRTKKRYDLITTSHDAINRLPGLNTVEFARLCYNRLTEEGIVCLSLPTGKIGKEEFKSLCKTWYTVFDHATLWYASKDNLLLVASKQNIIIDFCLVNHYFNDLNHSSILNSIQIRNTQDLLAHLFLDENQIGIMVKEASEISDNQPYSMSEMFVSNAEEEIIKELIRFSGNNQVIKFSDSCSVNKGQIRNQIRQLNGSLVQNAVLSFSLVKPHVDDFFEQKGLPFLQYP